MTKNILITLAHTQHRSMSDGAGNDLVDGQVATLPDDVADAFVAKGFGRPADGGIVAQAQAAAKAANHDLEMALHALGAQHRMELWDSLPAEVRARANEEGEHAVEEYLQTLQSVPLDEYEAAKTDVFSAPPKRRGRPPKPKTTIEGGDAND